MNALARKQKLIAQDRGVEWLCSWLMIAWAVCLAMPGDTLSLPSFRGFLHHGLTETMWAMFFGIVGGSRMAALRINGRWPRSAVIRQIGAFAGAFSWIQIALLIYQAKVDSQPWTPQVFISVVLAVYEMKSLLRARFDERYYNR